VFARKVVRFAAASLAASGSPAPNLEIAGIEGPSGLVFDSAGNLYVSASGVKKLQRYDAAVGATTAPALALALTVSSPPPVIGPLPDPEGLAFAADGKLWANFGGTLVALTAADLAGSGEKTVTPAVQKGLTVTALPHGLAFDEGGGLWVALDKGRFGRVAPTALAATGDLTPEVIIASPSVGYAGWFALYPAPATVGLRSSLP
jgi:sugar lactone lactonase YvrE